MLSLIDWMIILTNFLAFTIIQTLFFVFIASKEMDIVIEKKANMIGNLAKYDTTVKNYVDHYLVSSERQTNQKLALEQAYKRSVINHGLMEKFVGIPVSVTLVAMVIIFYVIRKRHMSGFFVWTKYDTFSMLMIGFVYLAEMFVYFAIVKQYQFVGDHEIISGTLHRVLSGFSDAES